MGIESENVLWLNERITLANLMQRAVEYPDNFLAQFVQAAANARRRYPEDFDKDQEIKSFIEERWAEILKLKEYFAGKEFAVTFPQDVEQIAA